MKHYTIGQFADKIGVTVQSLRNWDNTGKLKPSHVTEGGHRYYSQKQLLLYLGLHDKDKIKRKTIGYCRVSSNKQKDDLERQVENVKAYMIAKGYSFDVLTDIGSGINYNNKGLNKLIEMITSSEVDRIVVRYKDRLVRFGFELINNLCKLHDVEIEIIDNTEKNQEQELLEDLIQIVTVLSCRLQDKRANKAKKLILELVQDDTV